MPWLDQAKPENTSLYLMQGNWAHHISSTLGEGLRLSKAGLQKRLGGRQLKCIEALLKESNNKAYRSWLKKIRTIQNGFNQLPAKVDIDTADKVYNALLKGKRFTAVYSSVSSGSTSWEAGRKRPWSWVSISLCAMMPARHPVSSFLITWMLQARLSPLNTTLIPATRTTA